MTTLPVDGPAPGTRRDRRLEDAARTAGGVAREGRGRRVGQEGTGERGGGRKGCVPSGDETAPKGRAESGRRTAAARTASKASPAAGAGAGTAIAADRLNARPAPTGAPETGVPDAGVADDERVGVAAAGTEEAAATIRRRLEERLGRATFARWFGDGSPLSVGGAALVVTSTTAFMAERLRERFAEALEQVASDCLGEGASVSFAIDPAAAAPARTGSGPANAAAPSAGRAARPSARAESSELNGTPATATVSSRRHGRRLEDFVVGASNEMAYRAAVRMADAGDESRSLFLHGECGVGKTHLLLGICTRRRERFPKHQVLYTTGEAFTNEFIAHLRANTLDRFRARIRRLDLLAIDDVHFLADKTRTTSEFLHTMDAIGLGGNQVVLASDAPPEHIRAFSHALVSRLVAGLVVRIDLPDRPLRLALLRRLAAERGLRLSPAAEQAIVDQFAGSARELEGALHKLRALRDCRRSAEGGGGPDAPAAGGDADAVHIEEVAPLLRDATRRGQPVKADVIMAVTCDVLAVDRSELLGSSRHQKVVLGRAIVTALCRELTAMSYPEIAAKMGRTNHSTFHYAHRRLIGMIESQAQVDVGEGASIGVSELLESIRRSIRRREAS